jgi:YbbR domain-containing protein
VKRAFKWLFENLGWKLLALVSAVALWAVVASEPELSAFVTVPLAYKNLPDELEISGGPVNTVSLELRGPSGELRNIGDGASGVRPAVVIDMTGVQPGERTFPIGDGNVKLSRNVRLVRAVPSEARFEFEYRARRMVDVQPRVSADGKNGYTVDSVTVDPKQLQIVGPASRVARIVSVVTDRVDVSSVVGTAEYRVNAFVEDPYVRFEGSPQVVVTVTMKKQ